MSTFGTTIRTRRRSLDLTLEQVAEKAQTHKGYISGIETGNVNPPRPKFVKRLAEILGLEEEPLQMLAHAEKAPKPIRAKFVDWVLGLRPQ